MNTMSAKHVHYRQLITRLLERFRSREAVESDYRIFFVIIRDVLDSNSVLCKMCNASAHPRELSKTGSTNNYLHYSMLQGISMANSSKYDIRRMRYPFGIAIQEPFDKVYGDGSFERFYEVMIDGKGDKWWCIRESMPDPGDALETIFDKISYPQLGMSLVIQQFNNAIKNSGVGIDIESKEFEGARDDIMVALAASLHGIKAKGPIGSVVFRLHAMPEVPEIFGDIPRTIRLMSHSIGYGNPGGAKAEVNISVLDTGLPITRILSKRMEHTENDYAIPAESPVWLTRDSSQKMHVQVFDAPECFD